VAVAPPGVALAQGSGVGLGSAKKLSSAPPSTTTRSSTATTSTSTSTATTRSSTTSAQGATSSSSHAKQLAFTGANVPALVIIGGTLLLVGLALRVRTRDARPR